MTKIRYLQIQYPQTAETGFSRNRFQQKPVPADTGAGSGGVGRGAAPRRRAAEPSRAGRVAWPLAACRRLPPPAIAAAACRWVPAMAPAAAEAARPEMKAGSTSLPGAEGKRPR